MPLKCKFYVNNELITPNKKFKYKKNIDDHTDFSELAYNSI